MKSKFIICLLIGLFCATSAQAERPPSDCIVKDPKHIFVYMHGLYVISATISHDCYNKPQGEILRKGQTVDFWAAPDAEVRVEGFTGVGNQTVNQFLRKADGNYEVDCGGLMGSTNKCDHKWKPLY